MRLRTHNLAAPLPPSGEGGLAAPQDGSQQKDNVLYG